MTNQENALNAYITESVEVQEKLTKLVAHLEDHQGLSPDSINWSHQASLCHANAKLAELVEFFNL